MKHLKGYMTRYMTLLEEWKAEIAAHEKRIAAGETLTKEQEEHLDFLEQKLEDWGTD